MSDDFEAPQINNGAFAESRQASHRSRSGDEPSVTETYSSQGSMGRGHEGMGGHTEHPSVEYGGPEIESETVDYLALATNNPGPRPRVPYTGSLNKMTDPYTPKEEAAPVSSFAPPVEPEVQEDEVWEAPPPVVADEEPQVMADPAPEAVNGDKGMMGEPVNPEGPQITPIQFSDTAVVTREGLGQVVLERIKELETERAKKELQLFEFQVLGQGGKRAAAELQNSLRMYGFLIGQYIESYNAQFGDD